MADRCVLDRVLSQVELANLVLLDVVEAPVPTDALV